MSPHGRPKGESLRPQAEGTPVNATPDATPLSPVKQALLKIDSLRRELAQVREAANEPIAVVGIGCRLPGGADSVEGVWCLLAAGRDTITEVPPDRWTDALYDPAPGRPGTSYSRHGAFIDGVDQFDPAFFGISGREARRIDPQHRLLLECTWRAMEDARFTRESIKAHQTGVFVGVSLDDYARISETTPDAEPSFAQTSLGTARPMAAGRIAYLFDFHGPAIQLDTACSSSLVTLHLACQSLRQRECDVALAGGVNLMLSPEMTIALCELQALSPDGRCMTFDARANGYVRGEGCGMVALMRLSDARAQGRPIRALIRGSAVNHDGKSNGLTAPNGRAQREVIRAALQSAGVSPAEVDYVEAHGTGTALGDPIELRALHDVYCAGVQRAGDLHVGSVKTNIGHLEAAASVAALIKVVCALQHGELPRHLHWDQPTPHIDWAGNRIRVADRHMPWPSMQPGRRVAAVSAFGMSGTNAHLVVEAWTGGTADDPGLPTSDEAPQIVPFSAHTEASLQHVLDDALVQLRKHPPAPIGDLAHTLRTQRDTQHHRAAFVAADGESLQAAIRHARAHPDALPAARGRLAFLFTGQGAQYAGMAQGLYRSFDVVRDTIDACDRHFEPLAEVSLIDVLWGDHAALIDDTRYTQPALFAVEVALARLWMSWGVVPELLMGHSIGEYAAACVAGVFTLEDGLRLVAARGRLMHECTPPGRMSAVFAPAERVAPYLRAHAGTLALAGDNAPDSVVISGDPAALDAVLAELHREGIRTRPLAVSRGFHSPLMDPMLEEFRRIAQAVPYRPPQWPIVSNLTAQVECERLCDPGYWVAHLRAAVRFREGMRTLLDAGVRSTLEVGPGKVLAGLARACATSFSAAEPVSCLHSFEARHDEHPPLLESLAALWHGGRPVDWAAFERGAAERHRWRAVALPPYPFDKASYWVGTRTPAQAARTLRPAGGSAAAPAGLLGDEVQLPALSHPCFEHRFSLDTLPLLRGHGVHGQATFPAAGFIAAALEAAQRLAPADMLGLRDLSIDTPLALPQGQTISLVTVAGTPSADGSRRLDFHARSGVGGAAPVGAWRQHANASVMPAAPEALRDIAHGHEPATEPLDVARHYERLQALGLQYTGAFRALTQIGRATRAGLPRAVGRIGADAMHTRERFPVIHPAVLDNALQLIAAALWDDGAGTAYLPIGATHILARPVTSPGPMRAEVQVTARTPLVTADVTVRDDAGRAVLHITGLQLAAVDARRPAAGADLHTLQWLRWKAPAESPAPTRYVLLGDDGDTSDLRQALCDSEADWMRLPLPAALAELAGAGLRQTLLLPWPAHAPSDADEPAQVAQAHARFAGLWRTLQAAGPAAAGVSLAVLTRHGQALPGDPHIAPAHAAAWGLVRGLMHEAGPLPLWLVDLPPHDAASAATALRTLARAASGDDRQFVVRGEAVHVPRLARRAAPAAAGRLAGGSHLVTGARGAIGTRVVEWLIAQGAAQVVAVSRHLPAGDEAERLAALAQVQGCSLRFAAIDIADAAAVQGLVDGIHSDPARPLKGVFHAAGVLEDGLLATQAQEAVERVLAPKVAGSLNLHRATRHLALGHFVAFSSVSACLGSPGQCAYGAANAYLDALMLARQREGLPGHTINWGLWQGAGMGAQLDDTQRRRVQAFGLQALHADEAMHLLDGLRAEPQGQTLAWRVDVATLLARSEQRGLHALLAGLKPAGGSADAPAASSAGLGARLRALPAGERIAVLSAHLIAALARTLQTPAAQLRGDLPLLDLGMDSLMAAEFRHAIRRELDVDVPFGRLLEGATLQDIVHTVIERMDDGHAGGKPPTPAVATAPPRLDAVSSEARFGAELEVGEL